MQWAHAIVHFAAQTGTGQSMYQIARYTDENIGGTGLMWDILANETHFIFVEDVADICARALSLECETLLLNVGSGIATPVIDLAQKLKHLWQSNSDIQITGNFRVGDIRHNWADLTALHQVFPDWQPTSLAAGLESFVTWAKTQEIYEDRSKAATQELKQRNL